MNILQSYKNMSIILVKGNIIFVRDIVLQYFDFSHQVKGDSLWVIAPNVW